MILQEKQPLPTFIPYSPEPEYLAVEQHPWVESAEAIASFESKSGDLSEIPAGLGSSINFIILDLEAVDRTASLPFDLDLGAQLPGAFKLELLAVPHSLAESDTSSLPHNWALHPVRISLLSPEDSRSQRADYFWIPYFDVANAFPIPVEQDALPQHLSNIVTQQEQVSDSSHQLSHDLATRFGRPVNVLEEPLAVQLEPTELERLISLHQERLNVERKIAGLWESVIPFLEDQAQAAEKKDELIAMLDRVLPIENVADLASVEQIFGRINRLHSIEPNWPEYGKEKVWKSLRLLFALISYRPSHNKGMYQSALEAFASLPPNPTALGGNLMQLYTECTNSTHSEAIYTLVWQKVFLAFFVTFPDQIAVFENPLEHVIVELLKDATAHSALLVAVETKINDAQTKDSIREIFGILTKLFTENHDQDAEFDLY
ncbi:hypothetical protein KBC79_02315 [Candidatus Woesebacteria bacterium]|nr:hypothetical protein [Candidatus Woesebacteria bacterium]